MKINRLIWLDQYLIKIEVKHSVYQDEVREVLSSNPRIRRVGKGKHRRGEHLYAAYGQTQEGRYLTIFFIRKPGNEALIISARNMDNKERKQYGRK
ncbi:MAG: BrnT family toxin [Chloroflexi bacterium]|nr:BrnT family toxin [Chloroflexota bacterium]